MTLTFLILAGQVNIKGLLGEMAKCLEDGDKKIADLARMFFTELAKKDNAVYIQFVNMFGPLEEGVMDEEPVKRTLKFLCGFIEKVRLRLCFRGNSMAWHGKLISHQRTSMRTTSRRNLPPDWVGVSIRDNETIRRMHCRRCSIRMKKSPKKSQRGIELLRLKHEIR